MAKQRGRTLRVVVTGDAEELRKAIRSANDELDSLGGKTDKIAAGMDKWGKRALAASAVAGAALFATAQKAGALEQAVGGTEAVFKDASKIIDGFAKNSARSMGLSERQFREATTRLGGSLKSLGFDIDTAAHRSVELTQVASDLAATYGGTTAEAVDALAAAFRGEADPAERFNLRLNQATVNAKAVELGLAASTSQVDAHAKAQATLALIMEQSADAQGQFAREQDTLMGQQAILAAQWEDMQAAVGKGVMPVLQDLIGVTTDVVNWFSALDKSTQGAVGKFATFATIGTGVAGTMAVLASKAIDVHDKLRPIGPEGQRSLTKLGKAASVAGGLFAAAGIVLALEQINNEMGKFRINVDEVAKASDEELRRGWEDVANAGAKFGRAFTRDFIDQLGEAGAVGTLRRLGETVQLTAEEQEHLNRVIEDTVRGLAQQQQDTEDTDAALAEYGGTTRDAAQEVKSFREQLDDATRAMRDQLEEVFGLEAAVSDVEESYDDLADTLKENGPTLDLTTDKGRENAAAFRDVVAAQADVIAKMAEQGASSGELQRKIDEQKTKLAELAEQYGLPLEAVDVYIGALDRIPAVKQTKLLVDTQFDIGQAAIDAFFSGPRIKGVHYHTGGIFRAPTPGGEGIAVLRDGERIVPRGHAGEREPAMAGISFNGPVTFGADMRTAVRELDWWHRTQGAGV